MNYRAAYEMEYAASQLLYAEHPSLDRIALFNKSAELLRQADVRVPLAMFSDYRDGVIAGYEVKKKEQEA